jgi:putative hydrolase of the HAD superfamily
MSPLAFGQSDPDILQRQERDWWRTLVRNCLGAHGQHPGFRTFFDRLYAYYADPAAWFLYAEVAEVLDALDAAGIPMAVVSNFDSRLHGILQGLQVHRRFQAVLCSSEIGAAKPQAQIFVAACDILGEESPQVLHAGDNRRADFEGARNAGLRALWVRRREDVESEPDTARDLGHIPMMLGGSGPGALS